MGNKPEMRLYSDYCGLSMNLISVSPYVYWDWIPTEGPKVATMRNLLLCGSETYWVHYTTIIDDLIVAVYFYWKTINSGKVQHCIARDRDLKSQFLQEPIGFWGRWNTYYRFLHVIYAQA